MKIAVIGAGASGMMSAIIAAKNGAQVTLIEKNDRIGKKILATGNGKCNFTNKTISSAIQMPNTETKIVLLIFFIISHQLYNLFREQFQ